MNLALMAAQKLGRVIETFYNYTVGPTSTLLRRSIGRPFRAGRVLQPLWGANFRTRPFVNVQTMHYRLAAPYQKLLCLLTTDVVRLIFLSAIPALFCAKVRTKASTIIAWAIRAATVSPLISEFSTFGQSTTSDS
jgi:hypothetical protein